MRRVTVSIGKFLPSVAMANTAGFFQGFRFHSAETGDYRNELAQLAETSYQKLENEGLDPIRFVEAINARKFYSNDGNQLLNFLREYCWMIIQQGATKMDSADKAAITAYAYGVIREISPELMCDAHHIGYRGPDGEDALYALERRGNEILASLVAEKKEGTATFKMMKTVHELFLYVAVMDNNDSAPAPASPLL